ncbi:hypothetical protein JTE90_011610 [Oedothorax gibbosus]|uniref:EngB-type G domain-containing protein n=1 Tax=Oedothorax gibbosus TaxID=931172 RepID=A0AAV6U404_9ARAC|nr:hypothetical protein JTE90_011610 [Oedothorax gibbosus]
MYAAQELFFQKKYHFIKPIKFAIDPCKFPDHDLPEVVFIGKSNAGKSSLLKAIFKDYPNIRIDVSKRPGHTKCAKFYEVNSKLCIVDMPGYGVGQPEWFDHCVGNYLKYRKNLVRAFFLIDGKVGFEGFDSDALNMLEKYGVPYAFVLTKIDSAPDGRILKNLIHLKKIKDQYSSVGCFPHPFLISSTTYEGLAYLLAFIGHVTGNLNIDLKIS